MLTHVDHDTGHARAAAAACRAAADELRARAAALPADVRAADWVGGARTAVLQGADLLAAELRHEAAVLDDTAAALDLARARAVALDRDRAVELAARRRGAATCAPAPVVVGVGPRAGRGRS